MAEIPRMTSPDTAAFAIDRRHAIQWFALAVAGFHRDESLNQNEALVGIGQNEAARILDAEALRKAIRTAPEERPGQPGLYSLNLSGDDRYPVIGIRRTISTRSELHADFTDVWYVLEGTATLVTGGTIIDGAETATGEIRGRSITGGESRRIRAGDFAVVPAGVPHSSLGSRVISWIPEGRCQSPASS